MNSDFYPKVLHEVYASQIIRKFLTIKMDRLEELRKIVAEKVRRAHGVKMSCLAIQTESRIIKQQMDVVLNLALNEERLLLARKALGVRAGSKPLVQVFAAANVIGELNDINKQYLDVVPVAQIGVKGNGNGHAPTKITGAGKGRISLDKAKGVE